MRTEGVLPKCGLTCTTISTAASAQAPWDGQDCAAGEKPLKRLGYYRSWEHRAEAAVLMRGAAIVQNSLVRVLAGRCRTAALDWVGCW